MILKNVQRAFWLFVGRALSRLLFRITIAGRENLISGAGPLVIISNHFSWFEAPLIRLYLPYQITYLAATELQRFRFLRYLMRLFDVIPIWRGQVDRRALRAALGRLQQNGIICIFPEGGIDPDLQARIAGGEQIEETRGHLTRASAQLIPARPGAAYLALRGRARILPIAFMGTEKTFENLRRWRRTDVQMIIGPAFGPLTYEGGRRQAPDREQLNRAADEMMRRLAALLPPENRGPYA